MTSSFANRMVDLKQHLTADMDALRQDMTRLQQQLAECQAQLLRREGALWAVGQLETEPTDAPTAD